MRLWAKFCILLLDFAQSESIGAVRTFCQQEVRRQENERTYKFIDEICEVIGFEEGVNAWRLVKVGEREVEEQDEEEDY